MKRICMFCKRRYFGPFRAKEISHGLCHSCAVIQHGWQLAIDIALNVPTPTQQLPFYLWQDEGGEG